MKYLRTVMRMKLIILFCYICLLTTLPSWVSGQPIKTSGVTTIHITANNLAVDLSLEADIYHVFPAYDVSEVYDSLSANKTQAWLQCPVRVTQNGYLTIGQDKLKLWLVPGDTVHIQVFSLGLPLTERYRFKGRAQAQQDYYLAKQVQFTTDPEYLGMSAGTRAKNLVEFSHQLDSLTRLELLFWRQYQQVHFLPAHFIHFESDAIQYSDAQLRLYMSWYQLDYQKKKQSIPLEYFTFLEHLPARNLSAQYDYVYLGFLKEYVNYKVRALGVPTIDRTQDQVTTNKLINQLLGNDLGGFFRLWTISSGLLNNPEWARTELIANAYPIKYQYLLPYLKQRLAEKTTVLAPGDKAPGFFLPDTRDSLISLNQFKGQAVYLCFWFATCGGCYHEFTYENQLVEQFKNQPIQIVSVCTITKPDKWREAIKKVGLKTVNLLANSQWQKTLEEKYAISVYPHYVLIDADGRIVENFATRPSQNVAAKLKQVIAKMEHK